MFRNRIKILMTCFFTTFLTSSVGMSFYDGAPLGIEGPGLASSTGASQVTSAGAGTCDGYKVSVAKVCNEDALEQSGQEANAIKKTKAQRASLSLISTLVVYSTLYVYRSSCGMCLAAGPPLGRRRRRR